LVGEFAAKTVSGEMFTSMPTAGERVVNGSSLSLSRLAKWSR
jgi:hypothetical protein